ncbi:MAG: fasciclin domain-containing protein, partial [Bdellovibrionia bacterium]
MKSFLTSLLTLLAMLTAAALIVTFTGISPGIPGLSGGLATAQTTTGAQPAANATPAAGAVTPTPSPTGNIIQTMETSGQFTQALAAISAAGLTQTLESGGPYTVFAPTDAAFTQVPPAQLQAVIGSPAQLQQVLSYHVVSGEFTAEQLR